MILHLENTGRVDKSTTLYRQISLEWTRLLISFQMHFSGRRRGGVVSYDRQIAGPLPDHQPVGKRRHGSGVPGQRPETGAGCRHKGLA